jgi:rhamnogalacturonyl hydrolase YesR
MTGSLMIQAYRATNDTKYLDFCVNYLTSYMNNLQQANGLYWHHKDISKQFGEEAMAGEQPVQQN